MRDNGVLTLSYTESLSATDVDLTPQWSPDLRDWHPFGAEFALVSVTPEGAGRQRLLWASDPASLELGDRLFLRLEATLR